MGLIKRETEIDRLALGPPTKIDARSRSNPFRPAITADAPMVPEPSIGEARESAHVRRCSGRNLEARAMNHGPRRRIT